MSDASPFEEFEPAPAQAYPPADVSAEEDEEDEEEEEEDDPFASVDNNSSAAAPSGPVFDTFSTAQPIALGFEEETPLSIWEKERAQVLAERQAKADADKAAALDAAREELSKFTADQQARLEKTKKLNRADEKNFRADLQAVFAHGTKWEKVARLVNLAPKAGEKPGASRVERFRKLLIQLKTEKPKVAAA